MNVRLIAITQPDLSLVADGIATAEQLIVYAARVSNPSNQTNTETGPRLLKYCIRNGHWSVFETASMTVEVITSRAIAAQLLRHRSFTFQEFSQRYAEAMKPERIELRPRQHRLHPRRRARRIEVDPADGGMGHGRTHEGRVQRVGRGDVVDVTPRAGQKARVLKPLARLVGSENTHHRLLRLLPRADGARGREGADSARERNPPRLRPRGAPSRSRARRSR